jgi:hypothetical protein
MKFLTGRIVALNAKTNGNGNMPDTTVMPPS